MLPAWALHEPDIVLSGVNADRGEASQVQVLNMVGAGLQDHLVLMMLEQPVRIIAVSTVGRSARWLDIGDIPWLGPESPKKRVRAHGAGAYFDDVGLLYGHIALCPVAFHGEYQVLEVQRCSLPLLAIVRQRQERSVNKAAPCIPGPSRE